MKQKSVRLKLFDPKGCIFEGFLLVEAESNILYAKAEMAKSTEKTALRASPESSVAALGSPFWGCSSAGRAPALQAGGQGFDSPHLHHGGLEKRI